MSCNAPDFVETCVAETGIIADDLTAIIEGAFAMALDPTLVEPWLRACMGLLGCKVGSLAVQSPSGGLRLALVAHDDAVLDRYGAAGIAHLDPQPAFTQTLTRPRIFFDVDHVDETRPETRTYRSWLRSEAHIDHHMTAFVPIEGGLSAGISVHRAVTDGFFEVEHRRRMAAIFPALRSSFRLGFTHAEKLTTAFWEGIAATAREPAFLIGDDGLVLRMTIPAMDMLESRGALDVVADRLRCGDPAADARLQHAIAMAISPPFGMESLIRLPRRAARPPLIVTVFPLARSRRVLAPSEAAALVTVIDPATPAGEREGQTERLMRAFGLTPRESEIAAALLGGHSIESAATSLSISAQTVRVHLRHLFLKTGTSRQSDLIRLLARI